MKESQLENKTAIATNDYVRMVDENNNSVKIKKDSFMAAIRDALPSIISDGATDGGSVLSIINGALKTRTDANLASVLGANGWYDNAAYGDTEYVKIGICTDPEGYGDYVNFYVGWNTSRVQDIYKLVFIYHGCDIYNLGGLAQTREFFKDTDGAIYIKITGWQTVHFKTERAHGYTTYYNEAIPESQIDLSTLTPITVQ